MGKLIIENSEEEIDLEENAPIAEACEEAGVPFACTEGCCGTCVIEIIEGGEHLSSQTQEEEDFLGEGNEEERLACQCKLSNGTVKIRF